MQYSSYLVDTAVFTGAHERSRGYTSAVEPWRSVLIEAWKRRRTTLDELADRSKLNRGTIHRILDDVTKDPGINTVEKLSGAFEFSMIDLYTRAATIAPRPEKDVDGATDSGGTSSDPRLADRLGESFKNIFSAIDSVPIAQRGKFVSSIITILTSMEDALSTAHDRQDPNAERG